MVVDIRELLKAGAHFGHQKQKWNPKMAPYIFTERNGVHIINLEKTVGLIESAAKFLKNIGLNGESVLLVGTKRQAQEVIKQAAERAGAPYVTNRWLGGMLTNFQTIGQSIKRLKKYDEMLSEEKRYQYTKKELITIAKEKTKLEKNLSGIVRMSKLPQAVFVVDPRREHLAVHEATKLGIPVIAIIDTNGNPDPIDFPLPANDDGMRAIDIIVNGLVDAYLEGYDIHRQKAQTETKDHRDRAGRGDETRNVAGRKVKVKRIGGDEGETKPTGDGDGKKPARRTAPKKDDAAGEAAK